MTECQVTCKGVYMRGREIVRALSDMAYPISSAKFCVMLETGLLVSRWHAKRFGVNNIGKVLVKQTPDNIHVHLAEAPIYFI